MGDGFSTAKASAGISTSARRKMDDELSTPADTGPPMAPASVADARGIDQLSGKLLPQSQGARLICALSGSGHASLRRSRRE